MRRYRHIIVPAMLLLLHCTLASGGQRPSFISEWDAKLPSLVLQNVKLSGSPSNVWSVLSYDYGVRSVFVHDSATTRPFKRPVIQIDATTITVSALYDKLAEQCDYKWHTDAELGITWLFPNRFEYEDLLTSPVRFDGRSTVGLLISDVLLPLSESRQLGAGPLYSSLLARSVNHPVELPLMDQTTARELVNFMSASRLTQGFFIYLDGSGFPQVTPLNLSSSNDPVARSGEQLLAELEFQTPEPSADLICELLATGNDRQVHFAEQFLQLSSSRFPTDALLSKMPDGARRTALAIAASSIHIQSEGGALPKEMIAPILDAAADEALLRDNPKLYLRAAIEAFRLTGSMKGLDRFAEVPDAEEMLQSMSHKVEHAFRGLGVVDLEFQSLEEAVEIVHDTVTAEAAQVTTESAQAITQRAPSKRSSSYGRERSELLTIASDTSETQSPQVELAGAEDCQ